MSGMSHIVPPAGKRRVYLIRCQPPGHDRAVKLAGYRDAAMTRRFADRVDALIGAKLNGDPPPRELGAWIESLPQKKADRLVELGLLDRRRFEQAKPIGEHIDAYRAVVGARKNNTDAHASKQAARVRSLCAALNVEVYADLREDDALRVLKDRPISVATRHHYIVALKDFCKWMVRSKRAGENPMLNTVAPSQDEDPQHERRPLTLEEFRRLMAHLGGLERYRGQKAGWTGRDRQLIYWTAVKTGFRQNELASLTRSSLLLDATPAAVLIKARDAKNRTAAAVPIPRDLAEALRAYTEHLHPAARVFPFPSSSHAVVDMLRRDLEEAGVEHTRETGELVDFHSLRSTAICWWLDEDGLSPKRVQILARLKTLALVARYSRKLSLDSFEWLERSPKVTADERESAGQVGRAVGRA